MRFSQRHRPWIGIVFAGIVGAIALSAAKSGHPYLAVLLGQISGIALAFIAMEDL